ncbi:MAG: RT0821/Lpp0805 family surface protein [Rhizomicrobium sp.]
MKRLLLTTTAAIVALGTLAARAQPLPPPGNDPYGYYSQYDHQGYYDRQGRYQRLRHPDEGYGPPPPPPAYYEPGRFEQDCHRGNTAAGTIFGALAGGLLGGAVGHGNGGAVVGGAVLGGLLGNVVSRDIDCENQPYAFRVYAEGLDGDVGRRYQWRHGGAYGYFTPVRQFRRDGVICRDFTETSYRPDGRSFTHRGTACRRPDGNWHFD